MPSSTDHDKLKAEGVSFAIESFDFIFMAHLMKTMFGVANELNVALQKQDQDIVNAMSFLQELNTRFDEISTSLVIYTASLSHADTFCSFDKQKLLKLAEFYPKELSSVGSLAYDSQLDTYTHDVSKDERFIGLKNIGELSIKLVELNKHQSFDLVYLLIKLVLILSVATASVERVMDIQEKDKNRSQIDKTEHENGKSMKGKSSQSQKSTMSSQSQPREVDS
ncbi:zinc finger MYM-type protein 1-like protein [Tanacetum coccineum]